MNREALFWAKVDKQSSEKGCWIWTASKYKWGYGIFAIGNGRNEGAHRVSYAISKGPIPSDKYVCHSCDNPACVNPEHLFLGTSKENHQDSMRKGRHAFGERFGRSKLTEGQVKKIISDYASGVSRKELSTRYGVSHVQIWYITKGRSWKHLIK